MKQIGPCNSLNLIDKNDSFYPQAHIQFGKLANFYFLVNCVLSIFPSINTSNPIYTIFPFIFVTSLSAGKDAIEDWKKKKEDDTINSTLTKVMRNGSLLDVQWKEVELGDVVTVNE